MPERYTTLDEIEFLRSFAGKLRGGETAALEKLRLAYEQRSWEGNGMEVDRARVLAELDSLIACARSAGMGGNAAALK